MTDWMTDVTTRYFGDKPWDAPMYESIEQIAIERVAGQICPFCDEKVGEGDMGFASLHLGSVFQATHLECHLRSVFGGIAHIEGRCSCYGQEDDHGDMGWREEGKLVMEKVRLGQI